VEAVETALSHHSTPAIFNPNQDCQFTSLAFTELFKQPGINISKDGKGRSIDNVYVDRCWCSMKYEGG